MLFSSLIFVLFLAGAVERVTSTEWEVLIHRKDTYIDEDQTWLSTEAPVESEQTISWYEIPGPNDLWFWGEVVSETQKNGVMVAKEVSYKSRISFCEELNDGSWGDIMGQILRQAWLPNGSCDFEPGDYTITEPVGPLTLDIKDPVNCGAYALSLELENSNIDTVISSKYIIEFTEYPPTC